MNKGLKVAAYAFLASRVLGTVFVYLGHLQVKTLRYLGIWEGVQNRWLNPWTAYDSEYFLSIAADGYRHLTTPFFPLYPLLLRLGGSSEAGMAAVGILVSNLSFLFALYVLYLITEKDHGEDAAIAAVWILAFFPIAVVFSAVYTESLFLLLLLLTFYAARRERWWIAGLCGFLAALTRNPGLLLTLALLLEYFRSIHYDRRAIRASRLICAGMPVLGFLSVQMYFGWLFDTPFAGVASQGYFYRVPGWPWEPVLKEIAGFFTYLNFDLITFVNLSIIFLALYLTFRFRKEMRLSYLVIMSGFLLMNLCYYLRIPPHTAGTVRYMSVAFPFLQLLGLFSTRTGLWKYRRAAGGIYLYIFLLFSFLFGLKFFLG